MTTEVQQGSQDSRRVDSRRDFLKRAAVVAWSTPLVVTVMADRALANHTTAGCHTSGQACNSLSTTPQLGAASCCSGLTCCLATTAGANTCRVASTGACSGANAAGNAMCCSGNCQNAGGGLGFRCV